MLEKHCVNQRSGSPSARWPERAIIYNVGTEEEAWPSHCLHASWTERELAGISYEIFKGAIDFKSNQGGPVLGRDNVNNPRDPGGALVPDCKGMSKFLF